MSLEKYSTLHKYVQRIAEDDLCEDQDDAAAVAYGVGQVVCSVGSTIQAAAQRLYNANNPEAVQNFHAGVSMIADHVKQMAEEVREMVAPFAEVTDGVMGGALGNEAHMFNDGYHNTLLNEAQLFLGEHLVAEANKTHGEAPKEAQ